MSGVPFLRPRLPRLNEIDHEIAAILVSGRLTNVGPWSERLQAYCVNVRYCLAVSSGTTGLFILLSTVPKDSEVLVPSFTFPATVQALIWNGIRPRFIDVAQESLKFSLDGIEKMISLNTSAILAVNCFGAPCEIAALEKIAHTHGVRLFFDSAHAFGACYRGVLVGCFGDAEVFSLSATKVLPCGEGGLITTNDDMLCNY